MDVWQLLHSLALEKLFSLVTLSTSQSLVFVSRLSHSCVLVLLGCHELWDILCSRPELSGRTIILDKFMFLLVQRKCLP